MIKLPNHECSLEITHNLHKVYYEQIEEYISRLDGEWPSGEECRKAIDTNEIWEMRWYPRTPVGFCHACAASMEELLRFVNEE